MNDTSALLGQLKIDREPPPARSPWLWIALLGLALAAALAGWWLSRPQAPLVRTATVSVLSRPAAAASVLDGSGYVVARRQATVSSKVTGKVLEVLIEEGQRVEAGQVLARIDDSNAGAALALARSQLEAARAQLAEVQVQLAEAERTLGRNRELAGRGLVSQAALDAAQASRDALRARLASTERQVDVAAASLEVQQRQVEDTVVRAPFAGVITVKNAQPGEMISPLSAGGDGTRTGIGTLVDMDSLEVEVDVNENFINRVQPGQPVTATLNAYADWKIPAEVIAVIPAADRSKATVKVRVGLKSRDPRILPDMGVRVSFLAEAAPADGAAPAKPAASLPEAALGQDGGQDVVWIVRGETVERRAVKVGARQGGQVEIAAGLAGGETVVMDPPPGLADGAAIRLNTD